MLLQTVLGIGVMPSVGSGMGTRGEALKCKWPFISYQVSTNAQLEMKHLPFSHTAKSKLCLNLVTWQEGRHRAGQQCKSSSHRITQVNTVYCYIAVFSLLIQQVMAIWTWNASLCCLDFLICLLREERVLCCICWIFADGWKFCLFSYYRFSTGGMCFCSKSWGLLFQRR